VRQGRRGGGSGAGRHCFGLLWVAITAVELCQ
jgi:hypothetical protein